MLAACCSPLNAAARRQAPTACTSTMRPAAGLCRAVQRTTCAPVCSASRPERPNAQPGPAAPQPNPWSWATVAVAGVAGVAVLLSNVGSASADKDKIAEWAASGFIIKDTVEVTALEDPEVAGVTIYFSDFKRSLVDKLQKDFFAEPSQASLSCSISGPVAIRNEKDIVGYEGHEVFSERKGLNLFKDKTMRVRRVYDPEHRTVIYVAYSTRLSDDKVTTGRYRTSMCTVRLPEPASAPAPAASP